MTAFGAFVDIGVHQDGLVHVSQLADRFVKDPTEVVKVQQRVTVTVLEVDLPRKRIALSMRQNPQVGGERHARTAPAAPAPGPRRLRGSGGARPPVGAERRLATRGAPAARLQQQPLRGFAEEGDKK